MNEDIYQFSPFLPRPTPDYRLPWNDEIQKSTTDLCAIPLSPRQNIEWIEQHTHTREWLLLKLDNVPIVLNSFQSCCLYRRFYSEYFEEMLCIFLTNACHLYKLQKRKETNPTLSRKEYSFPQNQRTSSE